MLITCITLVLIVSQRFFEECSGEAIRIRRLVPRHLINSFFYLIFGEWIIKSIEVCLFKLQLFSIEVLISRVCTSNDRCGVFMDDLFLSLMVGDPPLVML
jgi:hypothetical protein